jgi:hypothetical protein
MRNAAAAVTAMAMGFGTTLVAPPAHAEPAYLSMSASIRMAVSDSNRSPGGNFLEH